jgi:hypothetical protein
MNRLYPAETRLKEGANAHDSDQTGGSVPLPRVGGALSARSRQYQGTVASMSNAPKAGRLSVADVEADAYATHSTR